MFIHTNASVSFLEACIGVSSGIAKCYASERGKENMYIVSDMYLYFPVINNCMQVLMTYSSGVLVEEFLIEPVRLC